LRAWSRIRRKGRTPKKPEKGKGGKEKGGEILNHTGIGSLKGREITWGKRKDLGEWNTKKRKLGEER